MAIDSRAELTVIRRDAFASFPLADQRIRLKSSL